MYILQGTSENALSHMAGGGREGSNEQTIPRKL